MYQINCWGPTLADAVKLGGAVWLALDGKSGEWDGAEGKKRVYGCLYKGKRDVIDPAGRLFCRQLDFRITFK
jgi:hypothetical protein